MPVAVQDVNGNVNIYDVLLDVVVHFLVPIFDVVLLPEDVEVVLAIVLYYFRSTMLTILMDKMMLMYWFSHSS